MEKIVTVDPELELQVAGDLNVQPPIPCPKRFPRSARVVVSFDVGGPMMTSSEICFITSNRGRSHRIIWIEAEFEDGVWEAMPRAWCRRAGISEHDAAYRLLKAVWQVWKGSMSKPSVIDNVGKVLSMAEIREIAGSVWASDRAGQ